MCDHGKFIKQAAVTAAPNVVTVPAKGQSVPTSSI